MPFEGEIETQIDEETGDSLGLIQLVLMVAKLTEKVKSKNRLLTTLRSCGQKLKR